MFRMKKRTSGGISVVEILMGLAVLVVVLSFASPSLSSATAKAEFKSAVENMEFSIRMARLTAQQLECDVVMHLQSKAPPNQYTISFSFPSRNPNLNSEGLLQEYQLPAGVRLESTAPSVLFDHRGMVEETALISLVSNHDDDLNKHLVID